MPRPRRLLSTASTSLPRKPRRPLNPPRLPRRKLVFYVPVWEGVFRNWAIAWVRKQHWRVIHQIPTEEDALQECAMIFAKCADRYYGRVNNPKWFMSLFKTAVNNYWNGMALRDREQRELLTYHDADALDVHPGTNAVSYNDAPFRVHLSQVSAELREVLRVLVRAPSEIIEYIFHGYPPGTNEITKRKLINRRLLMLCGFQRRRHEVIDFMSELEELTEKR